MNDPDEHPDRRGFGDGPARHAGPTLGEALKLAGFADTGGQAKLLIQSGQVRLNGVVETRRKRRVAPGDRIEVGGETFVLELDDPDPARGAAGTS